MKILFADKFQQAYLDDIRSQGHEFELQPDLGAEDLPGAIGDAEVLIVRSTKVTRETIEAATALKLIIRAGAGTNTIDKAAAAEHDIPVCNVPGKNALAVAELAFGLLLAIDRNIPDNVIELRAGKWNKKKYSKAEGICGRDIGIVGLGGIGLALAERAAAFGMNVHVIGKPGRDSETTEKLQALGAEEVSDLDELVGKCDVVSFHVPATDDTRGMVNDELLGKFRDGAILLNTSRGEIVDEAALIRALETKGMRAGLDVYNDEPGAAQGEFDSELARHPNVYGTHHIGASTEQAQNAIAAEIVRMLDEFGRGNVLHCVNL
ncbi:MAG: NAD(P)-dependent oxidoreductase [Halofilum sp. (in: g-proteobacteria)]|nr:NAD(P)-dependent oxidoreductase [Halofilum sp. (in: g-proteobacteria)]